MQIKYTKTELRQQQVKLTQLEKYLPTLQLKKTMLQLEIGQILEEIERFKAALTSCEQKVCKWCPLFTDQSADHIFLSAKVVEIEKRYENIAGVELPIFHRIIFEEASYRLFDTPFWLDQAISDMRHLIETREKMEVLSEAKRLLEKELREVSIRVNLFEKIMIPRTKQHIKKIKIFLGDQQLAAVSQAKASKRKILQRKGAI